MIKNLQTLSLYLFIFIIVSLTDIQKVLICGQWDVSLVKCYSVSIIFNHIFTLHCLKICLSGR